MIPADHPLVQAFYEQFGRRPAVLARAPGRVNLLGAHVDYNDGWVLPCAIDRSAWLAAAPNGSARVRVHFPDFDSVDEFSLRTLDPQAPANPHTRYPAGVAWALQEAGYEPLGMDAVLRSGVPIGAGVSSSAAVEMAFVLAWEALGDWRLGGADKARIGRRAENGFLGVQSGIMDQFASIHGAPDRLILLDCRSLEYELIPLPAGTAIVVADSRVRRRLAGSNYNVRREQCETAVRLLQPHLPGIRALRDLSPAQLAAHEALLPPEIADRARHVVEEIARVLAGAEALRQGDLPALGAAIRASHVSSRDLYEVSIPELDLLAETAWDVPGCYGARLVGAGFGGCVAALVAEEAVGTLQEALATRYRAAFGREPNVFVCHAAAGAELFQD